MDDDLVFRALADASRRRLLDRLHAQERPDARRIVRGARHDAPGGRQASGDSRRGEPRLLEAPGPGKAALHQSRADQRHRRALDHASSSARASARFPPSSKASKETHMTKPAESQLRLCDLYPHHAGAPVVGADEPGFRASNTGEARGPRPNGRSAGRGNSFFPTAGWRDAGEIVEFEPTKRLGIRWRNEFKPEFKAEGWSLCTMEIEPDRRGRQADRHPQHRARGLEIHRRRLRRLAADPLQPQIAARDRLGRARADGVPGVTRAIAMREEGAPCRPLVQSWRFPRWPQPTKIAARADTLAIRNPGSHLWPRPCGDRRA